MAKLTRMVFAEGVQWIGTKGSLKQIERLLEVENLEVTDRKQNLIIPSGSFFGKDQTVEINQWVIKDEGKVLIASQGKFNTNYNLK